MKEIFEWYEEQAIGRGNLFILELKNKIQKIVKRPFSHSTFYKKFRKASLNKYPYLIIYFHENETVYVSIIWHKKRNPDSLKKIIDQDI